MALAHHDSTSLFWGFLVIALFVLIVVVYKVKEKYESEKFSDEAPRTTELSASQETIESKTNLAPIESQPAADAPASSSGLASSPNPQTSPLPMSTPVPATPTSPTPSPSATPAATPTPTPSPSPSPQVPQIEIIFEANALVNVNVVFESGQSSTLNLTPGQVHILKARGKTSLKISDGGAVSIIVNGRDRGVPGSSGQPLEITVP